MFLFFFIWLKLSFCHSKKISILVNITLHVSAQIRKATKLHSSVCHLALTLNISEHAVDWAVRSRLELSHEFPILGLYYRDFLRK
jgi:hypothetical protein